VVQASATKYKKKREGFPEVCKAEFSISALTDWFAITIGSERISLTSSRSKVYGVYLNGKFAKRNEVLSLARRQDTACCIDSFKPRLDSDKRAPHQIPLNSL